MQMREEEMRPDDCYFDTQTGLKGTKLDKVRTYLREKLIRPAGPLNPNTYIVEPTKGRKQVHSVDMVNHTCTCQAAIMGQECSHIAAVRLFLDQVRQGGRDQYESYAD